MTQNTSRKRRPEFNPHISISTIGKGRVMLPFKKKDKIFVQGDARDGLFFVQTGKVRLSVAFWAKAISLEKVDLLLSLFPTPPPVPIERSFPDLVLVEQEIQCPIIH